MFIQQKNMIQFKLFAAQYDALQEELKRRRDECIQLRAVLAQQSQSLRSLGSTNLKNEIDINSDNEELVEAFQAQKLVNRQLESELTALTEENSAKLQDLYQQLDSLRIERDALQNIVLESIDDDETEKSVSHLKNRERYLKYELEKASESNVDIMEKYNTAMRQLSELKKRNSVLMNHLRDHGIKEDILMTDEMQSINVTKKKSQNYQGNIYSYFLFKILYFRLHYQFITIRYL